MWMTLRYARRAHGAGRKLLDRLAALLDIRKRRLGEWVEKVILREDWTRRRFLLEFRVGLGFSEEV